MSSEAAMLRFLRHMFGAEFGLTQPSERESWAHIQLSIGIHFGVPAVLKSKRQVLR